MGIFFPGEQHFLISHKVPRKLITKFTFSKFLKKKGLIQARSYLEFKDLRANSVDPDVVAHYELPHLDLPFLEIQLYIFHFWHSKS